ncbi:MAG: helix-turn-helix transcriptional regulator [Candidatus Marinimicrobia bacterium]|nr:helix-turn-helix transcriptional regulator [Candidatus Neomarinimicrobiota bacterium]
MQEIAARLKKLRKARGLSQKAFSDSLSLPLRTYQSYESGDTALKAGVLRGMSTLGVNVDWLLTGQGNMEHLSTDAAAQTDALIRYWEASARVAVAHLDVARAAVVEKYGEVVAAEIFDTVQKVKVSNIHFPYPVGKEITGVAEKVKKKSNA